MNSSSLLIELYQITASQHSNMKTLQSATQTQQFTTQWILNVTVSQEQKQEVELFTVFTRVQVSNPDVN